MVDIVLGTGRVNPPTNGHRKVFERMISFANTDGLRAEFFIIDGEKSGQDKKKNPLTGLQRIEILRSWFPRIKFDIAGSAFEVFEILEVQDKKPRYFVTGSDRVSNYEKLLSYVGLSSQVIGIDRATDGENISATLARKTVTDNDFDAFVRLMPSFISVEEHRKVFDALMKAMANNATDQLQSDSNRRR